eukprot:TRINITY_DN3080_c0_g2_i1.p1 TRINITY_DN3080_c0_g2~~TRINITY_DN3080_c0_g2_i1.p1  ORF type:complete len:186 (+),score=46.82 TRINITY_DN3080_c0_g2_i1:934-1491(+)
MLVTTERKVDELLTTHSDPLVCAVWAGDSDEVRGLLESGVRVDDRDRYGNTSLHYAALSRKPSAVAIVELLLEFGATGGAAPGDDFTVSPLVFVLMNNSPQAVDITRLLLSHGVRQPETPYFEPPLHYVARIPDGSAADLAELLLQYGESVDAANRTGEAPLDVSKNEIVQKLFREAGASVEASA